MKYLHVHANNTLLKFKIESCNNRMYIIHGKQHLGTVCFSIFFPRKIKNSYKKFLR